MRPAQRTVPLTRAGLLSLAVLFVIALPCCDDGIQLPDAETPPEPASAPVPRFEDITDAFGLGVYASTFGAAFADVDQDGFDDLLVSNHGYGPALYLNQGGRIFDDVSYLLPPSAGDRHGMTVADFDNDGDRDIVLACGGADGIAQGCLPYLFANQLAQTGVLGFEAVALAGGLAEDSRFRARSFLPMISADGQRVDLYLANLYREGFPNRYFRNVSTNTIAFTPDCSSGLCRHLRTEGLDLAIDYDRDGDQDLLLVEKGAIKVLTRDPGSFTVSRVIRTAGTVISLAAGDLNNDGYPDLFVGTRAKPDETDYFLRAAGQIRFNVSGGPGDGRDRLRFDTKDPVLNVDLLQRQPFGPDESSSIFLGPQAVHPAKMTFTLHKDAARGVPGFDRPGTYIYVDPLDDKWNIVWVSDSVTGPASRRKGVVGSDEILDVEQIETETFEQEMAGDLLYENRNGRFSMWPGQPAMCHDAVTQACLIADMNNDGHPDIVGIRRRNMGQPNADPFIVLNEGDGRFTLLEDNDLINAQDDLSAADQLVAADIDNDGRLDLFFTNGWGLRPSHTGPYELFQNVTPTAGHFVSLELVGTTANRDGFGAQVELYENRAQTSRLLGYREVGAGIHRSQSSSRVHFGLPNHTGPLHARVLWPSGTRSVYALEKDRHHILEEK